MNAYGDYLVDSYLTTVPAPHIPHPHLSHNLHHTKAPSSPGQKMAATIYPFEAPLPTMYLEETWGSPHLNQHHLPFPYLRHKVGRMFHNPDLEAHIPATDVRETQSDYFIDIELPGIKNKDKISVRWMSTRTLVVEARIYRPHVAGCINEPKQPAATEIEKVGACEGKAGNQDDEPCAECGTYPLRPEDALTTDGRPTVSHEESVSDNAVGELQNGEKKTKKWKIPRPHLTVNERRIGYFARNFNFPIDVDHDNMTPPSLQHGLLRIRVTKMPHERVLKKQVTVE